MRDRAREVVEDTYVGSIPADWKRVHVRDLIARLDAGVSVNGESRPCANGEKGILKVSAVSYGIFDPNANKAVMRKDYDRVSVSPKAGSILISRSNTPELVGASVYVEKDYPDLFLSDKLWLAVPREKYRFDAKWLWYYLSSPAVRCTLAGLATGSSSSMVNITKEELLGLSVPLPPYEEQREIVRVISAWDDAIKKLSALVAAKQRHKSALAQQLLTGKRRFSEFIKSTEIIYSKYGAVPADWSQLHIRDIARQVSKKNAKGVDLPVLSCTKYHGLVDSLEYFGKRVFSENISTYKIVRHGQFAYATNHIEEGSIGYQNLHDAALISPMYTVFETDKQRVDDEFLFRLLKTDLYIHIYDVSTSASVDRRGSLRWDGFSAIPIALPSLPEQRKIAEVLNAADAEVNNMQKQLERLKKQKQGLMEQLLTGKKRLNAKPKAA